MLWAAALLSSGAVFFISIKWGWSVGEGAGGKARGCNSEVVFKHEFLCISPYLAKWLCFTPCLTFKKSLGNAGYSNSGAYSSLLFRNFWKVSVWRSIFGCWSCTSTTQYLWVLGFIRSTASNIKASATLRTCDCVTTKLLDAIKLV